MFTLRLPSPGIWWLLPHEKKDICYKESGKWRSKWSEVEVVQPCPAFCDPMDCSPPGSSVHGILQAKILEWIAISFSRGSSGPRDWTWVSCTAGRFLPSEPPGNPKVGRLRYYFTKIIGINPELYVTFPPKNLTWGGKKENTWLRSESENMY